MLLYRSAGIASCVGVFASRIQKSVSVSRVVLRGGRIRHG